MLNGEFANGDEVVLEVPVYLSVHDAEKLWLLQYPLRSSQFNTFKMKISEAKIKLNSKKMMIDATVNVTSANYDSTRGRRWTQDSAEDNNPTDKLGRSNAKHRTAQETRFPSGLMDTSRLVSTSRADTDKCSYCVGILHPTDGSLHLTPLSALLTMRPDLTYVDTASDSRVRTMSKGAKNSNNASIEAPSGDDDGDDSGEEMKRISVRIDKPSINGDRSTASRQTDSKSGLSGAPAEQDECWQPVSFSRAQSYLEHLLHPLAGDATVDGLYSSGPLQTVPCSTRSLMDQLTQLLDSCANTVGVRGLARHTAPLSASDLNRRIRAVCAHVQLFRFCELRAIFVHNTVEQVIRCVQSCCRMVHGLWTVRSELLYIDDSEAVDTASTKRRRSDLMIAARDFILLHFVDDVAIDRTWLVKTTGLGVESILQLLSPLTEYCNRRWTLKLSPDLAHERDFSEVSERQQALWQLRRKQLVNDVFGADYRKPHQISSGVNKVSNIKQEITSG